jgi:hypothetical protein
MVDTKKKAKATLSCRRVRADVRQHGGRNPDPAVQKAVGLHLKDCPSCTEWVHTFEASLALFSVAPDVPVPTSVLRRVEARLNPQPGNAP